MFFLAMVEGRAMAAVSENCPTLENAQADQILKKNIRRCKTIAREGNLGKKSTVSNVFRENTI